MVVITDKIANISWKSLYLFRVQDPINFHNSLFIKKHALKNVVYIVTYVLQFFCGEGYWKCSNKTPKSIKYSLIL